MVAGRGGRRRRSGEAMEGGAAWTEGGGAGGWCSSGGGGGVESGGAGKRRPDSGGGERRPGGKRGDQVGLAPRVGFQRPGKHEPGQISAWGACPGKRTGRWASKLFLIAYQKKN